MSLIIFEDLAIRFANEVENFNRRMTIALAATNYQDIANFSPHNAFGNALNAYDILHEYYNTLNEEERKVPGIMECFTDASLTINFLGKSLDDPILPQFNRLKARLFQADRTRSIFFENDSLLPANNGLRLNVDVPNRTIAPAQLSDKSYLALLTVPNVLLVLLVGLVIRQLVKSTPFQYAVKTIFGRKKEKNDAPVTNVLPDHDAHRHMLRLI